MIKLIKTIDQKLPNVCTTLVVLQSYFLALFLFGWNTKTFNISSAESCF